MRVHEDNSALLWWNASQNLFQRQCKPCVLPLSKWTLMHPSALPSSKCTLIHPSAYESALGWILVHLDDRVDTGMHEWTWIIVLRWDAWECLCYYLLHSHAPMHLDNGSRQGCMSSNDSVSRVYSHYPSEHSCIPVHSHHPSAHSYMQVNLTSGCMRGHCRDESG